MKTIKAKNKLNRDFNNSNINYIYAKTKTKQTPVKLTPQNSVSYIAG